MVASRDDQGSSVQHDLGSSSEGGPPSKAAFVLRAVLCSAGVYALLALLAAFVVVTFFPTRHAHAMDELLYILLPMFGTPLGAVVGLVLALRTDEPSLGPVVRQTFYLGAVLAFVLGLGKLGWDIVERL